MKSGTAENQKIRKQIWEEGSNDQFSDLILDGKTRFFNASVSSALQGDSSGNSNLLATGEMTDKDSALVPYYSPIDVNTLSSQKD